MGKRNKDIPFKGPAGLNESVSNFQMFKQGAKTALNVFFKSWGSFKSIHKRKGKTRVNATAADGVIRNLKYYELGGVKYVTAYTDSETMYDVNMTTGALTQFGKNLGSNPTPKQFNDRVYFSNDSGEEIVIDEITSTANWQIIDPLGGGSLGLSSPGVEGTTGTSSLRATNGAGTTVDLGMETTTDRNIDLGNKYLELDIFLGAVTNMALGDYVTIRLGNSSSNYNIITLSQRSWNTRAGFIAHWNHIKIDASLASGGVGGTGFDPTTEVCNYIAVFCRQQNGAGQFTFDIDKIIATPLYTGVCSTSDNTSLSSIRGDTCPTNVKDIEVYDGRLVAVTKDSVYWSNPNAGYDFTTEAQTQFEMYAETAQISTTLIVGDSSLMLVGMSVEGYDMAIGTTIASIDTTTQITLSAATQNNAESVFKGTLVFGNKSALSHTGKHPAAWGGALLMNDAADGVSIGDVVSGTGIPAGSVVTLIAGSNPDVIYIDNTPTTDDTPTVYTFTDPDGNAISLGGLDSSNLTIDTAGDDDLEACKRLGNTLFLFKKHSMFRMRITGDTVIPYRIDPMYVGKDDVGVGCINKNSICYAVLGSLQEGLGEQEYLIFQAESDWYAIHEYGKPTRITPRVRTTIDGIPDAKKTSMFSVNYPKQDMVLIGYPTSSVDYCSEQLVYGTHSKEWSRFDWLNLTAAEVYIGATNSYLLLGDKDGYIYKHDYQTTTAATDYRDMIAAGTYIATDAQWELHRSDYGNTGTNKDVISTEVTCKKTATDMPITITVSNEKDTSNSTSISTNIGSATDLVQRVTTKMYGKYLSHKFSNAVLSNSMDILFWATEIRATGDNK